VCIEREILRVCVCWRCKFALVEALLEPWRSFEELWSSLEVWRPFGVSRCTTPRLVLFGGISKHWMCNPALCKFALVEALLEPWRSFEDLEAIWSLEVQKS
jgi:hypothetical protein